MLYSVLVHVDEMWKNKKDEREANSRELEEFLIRPIRFTVAIPCDANDRPQSPQKLSRGTPFGSGSHDP